MSTVREGLLNGSLYWSRVPPLPPRRHEALPQGGALLHGEVRDREAQFRSRSARPDPQGQDRRLRRAAAREAEGQAHLRGARGSVPPLLRARRAHARHHGRDPAAAARAAPRQRGLPTGLRDVARRGPPAGAARPLHGERPQGRHSVVLGEGGRRGGAACQQPQERGGRARPRGSEGPRDAGMDVVRRGACRPRSTRFRRASRSTCRCRNS